LETAATLTDGSRNAKAVLRVGGRRAAFFRRAKRRAAPRGEPLVHLVEFVLYLM